MKTILIEPFKDTYKIRDGTAINQNKCKITTAEQAVQIKQLEDFYLSKVSLWFEKQHDIKVKDLKILWMGIWKDKVEIGCQRTNENNVEVSGKIYFEDVAEFDNIFDKIHL